VVGWRDRYEHAIGRAGRAIEPRFRSGPLGPAVRPRPSAHGHIGCGLHV